MSDKLARALAGVPAYMQPFQGPHNEPYSIDALVKGASFGLPVSPGQPGVDPARGYAPNSAFNHGNPGNRMQMPPTPSLWTGEGRHGFGFNPLAMGIPQRDQVQAATMPPSQPVSAPPQIAQANPQASVMGFDSIPPVSMEMQGMAAPMPTGRNELERDYYAQLAQNPNGFNKGWLGRLFG